MWMQNGNGWIREIESQAHLDEGYTHWLIERTQIGKFAVSATNFDSSLHFGTKDTLDEAKSFVMMQEENKQPIFAFILIWLFIIGIGSSAVIAIGGA